MTVQEVSELLKDVETGLPEKVKIKPIRIIHRTNPGRFARWILRKKPVEQSVSYHVSIYTSKHMHDPEPKHVQAWLFNRAKLDYKLGRREVAIFKEACAEWLEKFGE